MKIESIGDVVAFRKYTFQTASSKSEVEFKIGKPFPSPEVQDNSEYVCPISITVDNSTECHGIHGVDSVQALLLGFSYVKARLQRLNAENGNALMWLTEEPGSIDIIIPDLNRR